jgi:hypothetical protein
MTFIHFLCILKVYTIFWNFKLIKGIRKKEKHVNNDGSLFGPWPQSASPTHGHSRPTGPCQQCTTHMVSARWAPVVVWRLEVEGAMWCSTVGEVSTGAVPGRRRAWRGGWRLTVTAGQRGGDEGGRCGGAPTEEVQWGWRLRRWWHIGTSNFDKIWVNGICLHLEDKSTHEKNLEFFWLVLKDLIWN